MPTSLLNEQLISLAAACTIIPPAKGAERTHLSTPLRWIKRGVRSPTTGERVRLEACRLGGRWMTSRPAVERFIDRLTPSADVAPPSAVRSTGKRRRASEKAARDLSRRAGI
jgi:hypothetical protein